MKSLTHLSVDWRRSSANIIIKKILSDFGITQEQVDKIKAVIDNVDIQQDEETTTIRITTKDITIVINK